MGAIKRKENGIFLEWRRSLPEEERERFVFDGIVDENEWLDTPFNVLFLLKEANGGEESWDERDYLAEYFCDEEYMSTHSQSIDALLVWLYGIFHAFSNTSWADIIPKMNDNHSAWLLKQIALVNMKKIPGTGTTNYRKFETFFNEPLNKYFLKKQLSIYSPDIVICGKTAYYLQMLDDVYSKDKWKETHCGIPYLRINNTIYLDFVHPLARVPKNYTFYMLVSALEEIDAVENLGWHHRRDLPILTDTNV